MSLDTKNVMDWTLKISFMLWEMNGHFTLMYWVQFAPRKDSSLRQLNKYREMQKIKSYFKEKNKQILIFLSEKKNKDTYHISYMFEHNSQPWCLSEKNKHRFPLIFDIVRCYLYLYMLVQRSFLVPMLKKGRKKININI